MTAAVASRVDQVVAQWAMTLSDPIMRRVFSEYDVQTRQLKLTVDGRQFGPVSLPADAEPSVAEKTAQRLVDQASAMMGLPALTLPTCRVCDDAGELPVGAGRDRFSGQWDTEYVPCPRCSGA